LPEKTQIKAEDRGRPAWIRVECKLRTNADADLPEIRDW